MRRGEVWWAELPGPIHSRPVVILTRDSVIDSIELVVVALVTRTRRGLQSELPIGKREGLPRPSVASLDNLLTVPKFTLTRQLGALSNERIADLNLAIKFALDIS